jgi:hypothetical protein
MLRTALPAALSLALLAPAAAEARDAGLPSLVKGVDKAVTTTVTADRAVRRDCVARPLAGEAGVVTRGYRAPADGVVTVRLRGGGDWDLALFDAEGRRIASSAAFAGNEVAQATLRRGARLTLQACRRSGRASTAALSTQLTRVDLARATGLRGKVQLVEVDLPHPKALLALEHAGLDVGHAHDAKHAEVVLHGAGDLRKLRTLGFDFEVLEDDLVAANRANRRREARRLATALPTGRKTYRTFEDYQRELKAMVEEHPDLVQPIALENKSFQGRDLQVVEIAKDVRDGDDGRPVFTVGAVHHAREWPAAEAAMEFAWDLLRNADKDPELARILREVRVVVMPLTNPDGFILSRNALDPTNDAFGAYSLVTGVVLLGGTQGYKRKNCNPVYSDDPSIPCELAFGVDPNRNYSTDWGGPGASSNPNDQSYRGAGPFSEPETDAVRELSLKLNSPVHMSLHNVAAKVLRAPGLKRDGLVPDEEAAEELGALVADPAGYANEYGWQLGYDSSATTKDWGYGALGAYTYTVELGPKGGDFHGDYRVHVVDQYLGRAGSDQEGLGLRKGLIDAALYTLREDQTSRVTGTAPAGATLRLRKAFETDTFTVCAASGLNPLNVNDPTGLDYCTLPGPIQKVPEVIDMTMEVPADGAFRWVVNPSTRPFEKREGLTEAYTLTCEVNGIARATREVVVDRGQEARFDLSDCG